MKQELYHYATALKDKNLSNFPIIYSWILLSMFLIPIMLLNIVFGVILFFSYLLLYFLSQKEPEQYNRGLLHLGLFLLFLGLEFSTLIQIKFKEIIPLVVAILVMLIFYEIFFYIKLKKKVYSNENQNKTVLDCIIPLIFGGTGVWAGKLIAGSDNTEFIFWVGILLSSLLIMYSFTFFQKYFICKLIDTH